MPRFLSMLCLESHALFQSPIKIRTFIRCKVLITVFFSLVWLSSDRGKLTLEIFIEIESKDSVSL